MTDIRGAGGYLASTVVPHTQPVTDTPGEPSPQAVEPSMLGGTCMQPTLDSLLHDRLSVTTFGQAQGNLDQVMLYPATTPEPSQSETAHEDLIRRVPSSTVARPHVCWCDGCERRYVRFGDLQRHVQTVHCNPAYYLCHFRRCPRSIKGCGFLRRDKLVDHLKSRKHGLSHEEAVYKAKEHNMDPWKARSQTFPATGRRWGNATHCFGALTLEPLWETGRNEG